MRPTNEKAAQSLTNPAPMLPGTETAEPCSVEEKSPSQSKSRTKRMLDRIFSPNRKNPDVRNSTGEDLDTSSRLHAKLHKEAKSRARESQQEVDEKARQAQRRASSERANKYRQDKKSQLAEEKRTREYYTGGMFWGFDPGAGMLRSGHEDVGVVQSSSDLEKPVPTPRDILSKPKRGETWGVQHGQPKKLDAFGVPIDFGTGRGHGSASHAEKACEEASSSSGGDGRC